jgi:hypothetical protein
VNVEGITAPVSLCVHRCTTPYCVHTRMVGVVPPASGLHEQGSVLWWSQYVLLAVPRERRAMHDEVVESTAGQVMQRSPRRPMSEL